MTNRTTLLSAVSAAALMAIAGVASAQTGPAGGAQTQPGGAMQQAPAGGGMRNDSAPGGAMNREAPQGGAMQRNDRNAQMPNPNAPNTAQQGREPMGKQPQNAAQGRDGDMKNGSKMGQQHDGRSDRGTVGSAASTSMTTEQKTKIRQNMMGGNAPRVNNINFSLNVGTVVPSHVHVVAVPPVLVEVHPEWRGYRYFVVNDEIVIVEPDTLRIVAVLPV